jgi:hypothetical protein
VNGKIIYVRIYEEDSMARKKFVFLFIAFTILSSVTLACGASSTTSVSPTSEITESNTGAPEYYLHDYIQKSGYGLSVIEVADPAKPGMLYTAEEGKKLVAIDIMLGNISGDSLGVNPLYSTLVDNTGLVYEADLGSVDNQIATLYLDQGEVVEGWVSFQIPTDNTAASFRYAIDKFGNDVINAPLTPAPSGHDFIFMSWSSYRPSSKLGETVEKSGYSLTALAVEDPITLGIPYTPKDGFKLVSVKIVVGNVSGTDSLSVNPLYAYLVADDGHVYAPELGGRDGQIDAVSINQGEKAQGWVSFTIPQNATPSYIKYELGVFSSDFIIAGLWE